MAGGCAGAACQAAEKGEESKKSGRRVDGGGRVGKDAEADVSVPGFLDQAQDSRSLSV